jgi:hypothetical protein
MAGLEELLDGVTGGEEGVAEFLLRILTFKQQPC